MLCSSGTRRLSFRTRGVHEIGLAPLELVVTVDPVTLTVDVDRFCRDTLPGLSQVDGDLAPYRSAARRCHASVDALDLAGEHGISPSDLLLEGEYRAGAGVHD